MNFRSTKLYLAICVLITPLMTMAQSQTPIENALRLVEQKAPTWGLEATDIQQLLVSDMYQTQHNGVTHIYFQQSIDNIPIYNALTGVHIDKEGKTYEVGHRFIPQAHEKITSSSAMIKPAEALKSVAAHFDIQNASIIEKSAGVEHAAEAVFEGSNLSRTDIEVNRMFVLHNGELRLTYDLAIDRLENNDYWSVRVDAATGEVLDQHNWTTYCKFDHDHKSSCGEAHHEHHQRFQPVDDAISAAVSGSYRVFELPAESPNHGPHVLVTNPHIVEASPNGWHDVDGDGTADYTITRGNNVHAYPDLQDNDESTGGEPDGGASLLFDYPYDGSLDPIDQLETAVVNLFYMSNMMHDISYLFGFDEVAGNFQQNNLGKGGRDGDYVRSEAQDGSGINNANFATPPDGGTGRMQMFLWNSGGEVFQVLEPLSIATGYETGEADFGANILNDNVDVEAQIVQAFDGNRNNPEYCCDDITNVEELEGKIAMIDRGGCFFDQKARNAEDAGAVAVLICNFDPSPQGMTGSGTVAAPTIPVLMLGSNDCALIKAQLSTGVIGKIKTPEGNLVELDGDYDNGIIAHEYGHGISNRLTAGPAQAGCLGNAEQMGEGWSDFFSLITTVKEGDVGTTGRGIGTYAQRQAVEGSGIRPRPYSTDFAINELTYGFIKDGAQISQPHGIGTIWCTMLWDLYWAMAEEHGFDPDYSNMNAGNNMAIQLVMDGMKLQPCGPGFVDGRDAILKADTINYGGANSCLIWEVFARRGLGYYADQGSANSRSDGEENFESAPLCQDKLRISKSAPSLIEPGDEFEVVIFVANNKTSTTPGVLVTDLIPDGCDYVSGSANITPTIVGDQLQFDLGDMESLQQASITYTLKSADDRASRTIWFDDMESGEDNWDLAIETGFTIWYTQDLYAYSGETAFYTENGDEESDQLLIQFDPLLLDVENPGMRFFHWYSTYDDNNGNVDGGVLQFSNDGDSWDFANNDMMLRNGYNSALSYNTFTIPRLFGFVGNSQGFIDTYVDLEDYKDQDVQVRFRFGTEEEGQHDGSLGQPGGWVVDDVEFLDLYFYKTDACVVSGAGDDECASLPGKGTLVEPKLGVNSEDLPAEVSKAFVYPSPATDQVNLRLKMSSAQSAIVAIVSEDGRQMKQIETNLREGVQIIGVDVQDLPSGTYFFNVIMDEGQFSRSFLKQ